MKTLKRTVSVLLIMALLFGSMNLLAPAGKAKAASYTLLVGDVTVTSDNAADVFSDGGSNNIFVPYKASVNYSYGISGTDDSKAKVVFEGDGSLTVMANQAINTSTGHLHNIGYGHKRECDNLCDGCQGRN